MQNRLSRRAALTLFAATLAGFAAPTFAASPLFAPPAPDARSFGTKEHGRRRVLLVGVSEYQPRDKSGQPEASVWGDLGSDADLTVLQAVLTGARWGFTPSDISVLRTKAQTTRAAILAALDKLVADTLPGDTVYFHYSGHGGLSYLPDGSPVSTIVPSDWRPRTDPHGDNHITSDELIARFATLRDKLAGTGSLFLTFDSCHSGKIVRGDAVRVRGADPRFEEAPPKNAKPLAAQTNPLGVGTGTAKSRGESEGVGMGRGFAALFACRFYQSACEIPDADVSGFTGATTVKGAAPATVSMGRFTYFLAKSLTQATPTTTYDDLYALICGNMASAGYMDQTPDLRGDTGFSLLGGAIERETPPLLALFEPGTDAPRLRLQIGSLHGVTAGSVYALYRVGDDAKSAKPVTSATVTEVSTLAATLTPDKPIASRDALRAVETAHVYGADPLVVNVKDIKSHPAGAAILAELTKLAAAKTGLIALTDDDKAPKTEIALTPTDRFAARQSASVTRAKIAPFARGFVLERTQDGSVMSVIADDTKETPEVVAKRIAARLQTCAVARVVRGITQNEGTEDGDGVRFTMRLLPYTGAKPAKLTLNPDGTIPGVAPATDTPKTDWRVGESFVIQIKNVGTEPGFVNLLDILPDGTISMILPPAPHKNGTLSAWKAQFLPGEEQVMTRDGYLLVMDVTEPLGIEQYKLIATATEADFSSLVTRDPGAKRSAAGDASRLGTLLGAMNTGKRASAAPVPEGDTDWCTATVATAVLAR